MAGGDVLRPQLIRPVNQPAKLEILIAHHTRVRRAPGLVFVRKVVDDVLLKFRRLVDQVIRNAQLVADGARIGDGLRAAALVLGTVHAVLRPELERDADNIVALLQQQCRRGGGVHSPAHAADHALTLFRIHRRTLYQSRAACKMVCEDAPISLCPICNHSAATAHCLLLAAFVDKCAPPGRNRQFICSLPRSQLARRQIACGLLGPSK